MSGVCLRREQVSVEDEEVCVCGGGGVSSSRVTEVQVCQVVSMPASEANTETATASVCEDLSADRAAHP